MQASGVPYTSPGRSRISANSFTVGKPPPGSSSLFGTLRSSPPSTLQLHSLAAPAAVPKSKIANRKSKIHAPTPRTARILPLHFLAGGPHYGVLLARLAEALCRRWEWRDPAGQLQDTRLPAGRWPRGYCSSCSARGIVMSGSVARPLGRGTSGRHGFAHRARGWQWEGFAGGLQVRCHQDFAAQGNLLCPVRMGDKSPMLQRSVGTPRSPSPVGTTEEPLLQSSPRDSRHTDAKPSR